MIRWGDGQLGRGYVKGEFGVFDVYAQHKYVHAGEYTAQIFVQNQMTQETAATFTQFNVTPEIPFFPMSPTGSRPVMVAGESFTGTVVSFIDDVAFPVSSYQVKVDWGDGSPEDSNVTLTPIPGGYSIEATHTYSSTGVFPIIVEIERNGETEIGRTTATVTGTGAVFNPINLTIPADRSEMQSDLQNLIVADFTFGSQIPSEGLNATVTWHRGDENNNFQDLTFQAQVVGSGGQFYVVSRIPKTAFSVPSLENPNIAGEEYSKRYGGGWYAVEVSIRDSFGLTYTTTTAVTTTEHVENEAFEVRKLAWFHESNGSALQHLYEPEYTALINWADGTAAEEGNTVGFRTGFESVTNWNQLGNLQHLYSNPGVFNLGLLITDSTVHGGVENPEEPIEDSMTSATHRTSIADSPLQFSTPNISILRPRALHLEENMVVGQFIDLDSSAGLTDYQNVLIHWGDGTSSVGEVIALEGNVFQIIGDHTYTTTGSFSVLTVLEGEGGQVRYATSIPAIVQPGFLPWELMVHQRRSDPDEGQTLAVGSGLIDINTGALLVDHTLDFDQSPGTMVGRSPALVYNSKTVNVRPILEAVLPTDENEEMPTVVKARLTWDGTVHSWVQFDTSIAYTTPGQLIPFALQVDQPVTVSGMYDWIIDIEANFVSSPQIIRQTSGRAQVVVRDNSPFGSGWSITGIHHIVFDDAGALLIYGNGDSRYFEGRIGGTYTSPPEDFGELRVTCDDTHTYQSKYGDRWVFDSNTGLMLRVMDRHGNSWEYGYTNGYLTSVTSIDSGLTTITYLNNEVNIIQEGNRTEILTLTPTADGNADLTKISGVASEDRLFTYSQHFLISDDWGAFSTDFTFNVSNNLLSTVTQGETSQWNIVSPESSTLDVAHIVPVEIGEAFITNPLSDSTTYVLDSLGRIQKEITPILAESIWDRNPAGQIVHYTDPRDNPTSFVYHHGPDGKGDLIRIENSDRGIQQFRYSPIYHQISVETDSRNNSYRYFLNATEDAHTTINPMNESSFAVWNTGLLDRMTNAKANTTRFQ